MSPRTEPFSETRDAQEPADDAGCSDAPTGVVQPLAPSAPQTSGAAQPQRVIIEVGTLEGVVLATSAVESISNSHARDGTSPPSVEILTPFPHAFDDLATRHAFVALRKVSPSGDGPEREALTPGRAFAVRMIGGPETADLSDSSTEAALARAWPAAEAPARSGPPSHLVDEQPTVPVQRIGPAPAPVTDLTTAPTSPTVPTGTANETHLDLPTFAPDDHPTVRRPPFEPPAAWAEPRPAQAETSPAVPSSLPPARSPSPPEPPARTRTWVNLPPDLPDDRFANPADDRPADRPSPSSIRFEAPAAEQAVPEAGRPAPFTFRPPSAPGQPANPPSVWGEPYEPQTISAPSPSLSSVAPTSPWGDSPPASSEAVLPWRDGASTPVDPLPIQPDGSWIDTPDAAVPDAPVERPARGLRVTRRTLLAGVGLGILGGSALAVVRRRTRAADGDAPRPLWPVDVRPLVFADFFLKPLIEDAWQRRAARQRADREYPARINEALNRERYNALLFGWGEEHGETYADYAGSVSVLSFDIRAGLVDSISLSRDIRAPELERIMGDQGRRARVLRHAFQVGMRSSGGDAAAGFTTLRQVVESMTGLAIDHQFLVKDVFLRDFIVVLIEKLGRPLQVMVDKPHMFAGFRLGGRDYAAGVQVQAGRQAMDSFEAMRYMVAEDQHPVGRQDERSFRKSALFHAMLEHLQVIVQNDIRRILTPFSRSILDDLLALLVREHDIGAILVEDTKLQEQIIRLFDRQFWLGQAADHLLDGDLKPGKLPSTSATASLLRRAVVVHDPYYGDGGVLRVHNIRDNIMGAAHPTIQREVTSGILSPPELGWMLIPPGGDPYAQDLIRDYWGAVREFIVKQLTASS